MTTTKCLTYSRMTLAEAPTVAAMVTAAYQRTGLHHFRETAAEVLARAEQCTVLVFRDAAGPVATAAYAETDKAPGTAVVLRFAVLPACQGRGYGREVLSSLIERLQSEGFSRAGGYSLQTMAAASQLYRSAGVSFVPTADDGHLLLMNLESDGEDHD